MNSSKICNGTFVFIFNHIGYQGIDFGIFRYYLCKEINKNDNKTS